MKIYFKDISKNAAVSSVTKLIGRSYLNRSDSVK